MLLADRACLSKVRLLLALELTNDLWISSQASTSKSMLLPVSGPAKFVRFGFQSYHDQADRLAKFHTVVLAKAHIRLCLVEGLGQAHFHPRQAPLQVHETPCIELPFGAGPNGIVPIKLQTTTNEQTTRLTCSTGLSHEVDVQHRFEPSRSLQTKMVNLQFGLYMTTGTVSETFITDSGASAAQMAMATPQNLLSMIMALRPKFR